MVHLKRGLECLNTLLFCDYNESSTFYIFMIYILIHTVLAVEFVVVFGTGFTIYVHCTVLVLIKLTKFVVALRFL